MAEEVFVNIQIHLKEVDTDQKHYRADVCSMLTVQANEIAFPPCADGKTVALSWENGTTNQANVWFPKVFGFLDSFGSSNYNRIHAIQRFGANLCRRMRIYAVQTMSIESGTPDNYPFDTHTVTFSLLLDQGPCYKLRDAYFIDGQYIFDVVSISHETTRADFFGDSCEMLWRYTMTVELIRRPYAADYAPLLHVYVIGFFAPLLCYFDTYHLIQLFLLFMITISGFNQEYRPRPYIQRGIAFVAVAGFSWVIVSVILYGLYASAWVAINYELFARNFVRSRQARMTGPAAENAIPKIAKRNWRFQSDNGVAFETMVQTPLTPIAASAETIV